MMKAYIVAMSRKDGQPPGIEKAYDNRFFLWRGTADTTAEQLNKELISPPDLRWVVWPVVVTHEEES